MFGNTKRGLAGWACAILISFFATSFIPASNPDPGSYEFYKLNFRVKQPVVRPDLEEEMLGMINKERAKEGLNPMVADAELTEIARRHSTDMFNRGYFSHYTPEKVSPFDRMKESNITYIKAGENLSMAPTLASSHRGLMKSPGHRDNIMKPVFTRVGIGIMDGGRYGIMVTQDFTN
jgi:uncharacterized protein YkwD